MFLDFLEKREEADTIQLTDEEKLFLKVFGIESDQPAPALFGARNGNGAEKGEGRPVI